MKAHHGNLRAALIDAGQEMARRGGPEALHLRGLTQRVDVTPNAVYRHFSNQACLVRAICNHVQDRLVRTIQDELPDDQSRLCALYQRNIRFGLEEPGWYRLITLSRRSLHDPATRSCPTHPLHTLFEKLRTAYVDSHSPPSPSQLTWSGWAPIHGFSSLAANGFVTTDDPKELVRVIDRTVLAALHADSQSPPYPGESTRSQANPRSSWPSRSVYW